LARVESPEQTTFVSKILKNSTQSSTKESRIPKLSQRITQDKMKKKKSPQKSKSQSQKRLTFQEPDRAEPQTEGRRGIRKMRDLAKSNMNGQRPAGVPSVRNRFDQDWMRLHKTGRPNSVPTRINRFTVKAPTDWRLDNSTFEKDKPRIKRSGSRKSAKSGTAVNYPDWWGDGSIHNSQSSHYSRSRSRYDENEVDDFDRKVTFKQERKRILKPTRNNNFVSHAQNQASYEEEYLEEEEEEAEQETEEVEEIQEQRVRRPQKVIKRNDKPQVGEKIRKGMIYSKLNSNDHSNEREEERSYRETKSG